MWSVFRATSCASREHPSRLRFHGLFGVFSLSTLVFLATSLLCLFGETELASRISPRLRGALQYERSLYSTSLDAADAGGGTKLFQIHYRRYPGDEQEINDYELRGGDWKDEENESDVSNPKQENSDFNGGDDQRGQVEMPQDKARENGVAEDQVPLHCDWCHGEGIDSPPRKTEGPLGLLGQDSLDDLNSVDNTNPDIIYSFPGDGADFADSGNSRLIDDMVAPFFLLAAILLILALVYTLLFLCVVRLGTIRIDEDRFPRGRVYFFGNFCFVPLCWFYRLYAADPSGEVGIASSSDAKVMGLKREERKNAVRELLRNNSKVVGEEGICDESDGQHNQVDDQVTACDHNQEIRYGSSAIGTDDEINGSSEMQCSICICEYEPGDVYIHSPTTCPHRFHQDCLVDWLTLRCNTSCPTCRRDLVSNDDVWEVHQRLMCDEKNRKRKQKVKMGLDLVGAVGRRRNRGRGGQEELSTPSSASSTSDDGTSQEGGDEASLRLEEGARTASTINDTQSQEIRRESSLGSEEGATENEAPEVEEQVVQI